VNHFGDLNRLKPLFGGMFADYLQDYSHWGWIDLDTVVGDMSKMIDDLKSHHVVTYMDGVRASFFCGV
jgi:hypothetical protein